MIPKELIDKIMVDGELLSREDLLRNMSESYSTEKGGMVHTDFFMSAINSKNTQDLIESNEKLSKSNEEHQRAITKLTFALVFVGIVQAFMMIIGIIVQIGVVVKSDSILFNIILFGPLVILLIYLLSTINRKKVK